ncbi:hypothetical protein [Streptomyces cinereoruber]|uniref:hypothetical protein n=1 Tax=Streptomyces cinereoruber TaxID=67260 RepID=UPI00363E7F9B
MTGQGDDLEARRRNQQPNRRRTKTGTLLPSSRKDLPGWVTSLSVPKDACDACARHWHHKCWGVNVLLDPIPNCPCDCGDRKDPARLSPQAWADLALHAPDEVWVAAMFERQRAAGLYMCVTTEEGRHRAACKEELQ